MMRISEMEGKRRVNMRQKGKKTKRSLSNV